MWVIFSQKRHFEPVSPDVAYFFRHFFGSLPGMAGYARPERMDERLAVPVHPRVDSQNRPAVQPRRHQLGWSLSSASPLAVNWATAIPHLDRPECRLN
jgi:hypothetical protein